MRLSALVMTACAVYYVAVILVKEPRHMRLDTGLRPAQGVRDYCDLGGRSDPETEGSRHGVSESWMSVAVEVRFVAHRPLCT